MKQNLTFALLFNFSEGEAAALSALEKSLPGAIQERGALVYKGNVLKFGKNPLAGGVDDMDYEISAFPLIECDAAYQCNLLKEVREKLSDLVGRVDVLAEEELLSC